MIGKGEASAQNRILTARFYPTRIDGNLGLTMSRPGRVSVGGSFDEGLRSAVGH